MILKKKINLLGILRSINVIQTDIGDKDKNAIIIRLHVEDSVPVIEIKSFRNTTDANKKLFELEKEFPDDDIVLVKADKISSIRNIFRNYFTDAKDFINYVENGILAISQEKTLYETISKKYHRPKQLTLNI